MQGLLLVYKPKHWTSFDAVNYVRKLVAVSEGKKPRNVKVGHTGTLDPLATGLLVLLIGKNYTRRAGELSKLDKTYEVTMHLGLTSTTGDEEGTKTTVSDDEPSMQAVQKVLQDFTGHLMQTPPAFSAMKIDGKRAYALARAGAIVELKQRPVTVYAITEVRYGYPFVYFTAAVGSGTYIRSLVEDIGHALGTGAYMSDLVRTRVGSFSLKDACRLEGLDAELLSTHLQNLASEEVA